MRKESNSKIMKRSFGTTMGITSIIAILVILVLVVFSTLSLVTAKADLNLSQKTADNIKAYYIADGNAEKIMAEFGDIINSEVTQEINTGTRGTYASEFAKENNYEYESTDDGRLLKFTLQIDDSRKLKVEVLYDDKGRLKERQLWQIIPAEEWKEDNDIQLFDPGQ